MTAIEYREALLAALRRRLESWLRDAHAAHEEANGFAAYMAELRAKETLAVIDIVEKAFPERKKG